MKVGEVFWLPTGEVFWSEECADPLKAINFIIEKLIDNPADAVCFLRSWNVGDVHEWPEFLEYVRSNAH